MLSECLTECHEGLSPVVRVEFLLVLGQEFAHRARGSNACVYRLYRRLMLKEREESDLGLAAERNREIPGDFTTFHTSYACYSPL